MSSDCIELDSSHPAGPKEHVSLWSKSQSPFHRLGGTPDDSWSYFVSEGVGIGWSPIAQTSQSPILASSGDQFTWVIIAQAVR